MALTKVSTDGVKDDAITKTKIPANQIEASELADNAVDTNAIANNAVTAGKLASGITDLSNDTSPQLGGDLASNGNNILIADNDEIRVGTGGDLQFFHDATNSHIYNATGNLRIRAANNLQLETHDGETHVKCVEDGAVELYHNNEKVLATDGSKVNFKQRIQIHNDAPASGHGMAIGQWDGSNHRIEGDANRPIVITSYNSGGIKMGVSGANKVAVNSHGIVFNGDTAAANALDDYEEGSWTPTVSYGSGGYQSANNVVCTYTKVGNLVHVSGRFSLTQSGSGDLAVEGLPFAKGNPSGDGNSAGIQIYVEGAASNIANDIVGLVLDASTAFLIRRSGSTSSGGDMAGLVDSGTNLLIGGCYQAG